MTLRNTDYFIVCPYCEHKHAATMGNCDMIYYTGFQCRGCGRAFDYVRGVFAPVDEGEDERYARTLPAGELTEAVM